MKFRSVLLFLVGIFTLAPFLSSAQGPQPDSQWLDIWHRDDKISRQVYIDSAFVAKYNLFFEKKVPKGKMVIWQNPLEYNAKKIIKVYDIRWKFKNHQEALAFHKKYLATNSEGGVEIKNYKFKIPNVTALHVSKPGEALLKFNDPKYPMSFYCFVYVTGNYVSKVYVNGKPNLTVEDAAVFAQQAAKRTNAYIAKGGK